jgi:RNA polymerase sigma factor (sigma-70 family)
MSLKLDRITEIFIKDREKFISYIRKKINKVSDMDAEDIMSEVFINIFNKADITNQIENLTAYIYTSLRNRVIDLIRSSNSLGYSEKSFEGELNESIENIPDKANDIESILQRKEDEKFLYSILMKLEKDHRDIIIATELEGRSFKELSAEWGVPIGTLLSRKNRAINKLKQNIKNME